MFQEESCLIFPVDNLQKFEVRVSSINSTTFPTTEGEQCAYKGTTLTFNRELLPCTRPITGRYVIVFKPANNFLTMCEVKVFGEKLQFTGMSVCICFHHFCVCRQILLFSCLFVYLLFYILNMRLNSWVYACVCMNVYLRVQYEFVCVCVRDKQRHHNTFQNF